MLALLLVVGHACELPVYASLASHAAEDAHHSTDDHADGNLTSCDATVGVLSNAGYLHAGPGLDVTQILPVAEPVRARLLTAARDDSKILQGRPPLFLLHASLLI